MLILGRNCRCCGDKEADRAERQQGGIELEMDGC
jgi:hypothetical protein